MMGGGHYSLASRNSVHTPIERFQGKILGNTAKALHKFWEAPGPKKAADVWHGYTHVVFNVMNHGIESKGFQTAMLGKVLRQDPLMSKHFLKTSRAAVEEAAKRPEEHAEPDPVWAVRLTACTASTASSRPGCGARSRTTRRSWRGR
jgi:hypothetical protein